MVDRDDPFDIANKFHLAHLRATLQSLGRPETVSGLDEHLALIETSREKTKNGGTKLSLLLCQKLGRDVQRYNAFDGTSISYYTDFAGRHGNAVMPKTDALALAITVAKPPDDAVLETSDYETLAGHTYFRACWRREQEGIPVEGDYIEVLVNTTVNTVFSVARNWRKLSFGWVER